MLQIVQQLGGFFLDAVPTMILFIVLVLAYQFLVQGPLSKTLAERRARTTGAVEDANKAIAAAEAKTAEYGDNLRHARAEVFRAREQRLQQWSHERDSVLDNARKAAAQHLLEAKLGLEEEAASSRKTLMASADQLAEQVVRAVMPATAGGSR